MSSAPTSGACLPSSSRSRRSAPGERSTPCELITSGPGGSAAPSREPGRSSDGGAVVVAVGMAQSHCAEEAPAAGDAEPRAQLGLPAEGPEDARPEAGIDGTEKGGHDSEGGVARPVGDGPTIDSLAEAGAGLVGLAVAGQVDGRATSRPAGSPGPAAAPPNGGCAGAIPRPWWRRSRRAVCSGPSRTTQAVPWVLPAVGERRAPERMWSTTAGSTGSEEKLRTMARRRMASWSSMGQLAVWHLVSRRAARWPDARGPCPCRHPPSSGMLTPLVVFYRSMPAAEAAWCDPEVR